MRTRYFIRQGYGAHAQFLYQFPNEDPTFYDPFDINDDDVHLLLTTDLDQAHRLAKEFDGSVVDYDS